MPILAQGPKAIIPRKETSGTDFASLDNKWEFRMRKKEIPPLSANYFGTGADGDTTISADTSLTSTQDGDIVVKNYGNLTIDASKTLTVSNRCRGLLLFVDGDLTVNGTIDMTARGCHANPATAGTDANTPVAPSDGNAVGTNGIRFPFLTASDTDVLASAEFEGCGSALYDLTADFPELVSNGKIIAFPRVGGTGGAPVVTSNNSPGNAGGNVTGGCGGGGSGGGGISESFQSDAGGNGTCFSGGVGSGGRATCLNNPSNYGGAGQDGSAIYDSSGTGNPSGVGFGTEVDGTGGLLIIICSGNITGTGTIKSHGILSQPGKAGGYAAGGASGGGNILVARVGTDSSVSKTATGGVGGTSPTLNNGGDGGAGSIQTLQISA